MGYPTHFQALKLVKYSRSYAIAKLAVYSELTGKLFLPHQIVRDLHSESDL